MMAEEKVEKPAVTIKFHKEKKTLYLLPFQCRQHMQPQMYSGKREKIKN